MPDAPVNPLRVAQPPAGRPVLLYDGECTFCRMWVDRWRAAAADKLDVEPSQTAGPRFPEIPPTDFYRAVHLVETDGRVFSGAEAILRARKIAIGRSMLLRAYERLPGFAPATDVTYRLVAGHRPLLSRLTRILWDGDVRKPEFGASSWIFLRLLGVIHLIAFVSFWIQLNGLVGKQGVLPAQMFF